MFIIWAIVALLAAPNTEKPQDCGLLLHLASFGHQDVSVRPGRIKGPDCNLFIEDDVIYGFVHGEPTRFRVLTDHITGSVAGMDLMLQMKKSDLDTEIAGLVGARRVTLKLTPTKITVSAGASAHLSGTASLALVRSPNNDGFYGHVGMGGDLEPASLQYKNCDHQILYQRPDLLVVLFLWWLGG